MVHVDNCGNPTVACPRLVTSTNVLVHQSDRSTTQIQDLAQLKNWLCGKFTMCLVVKRSLKKCVLDVLLFNGELICERWPWRTDVFHDEMRQVPQQ